MSRARWSFRYFWLKLHDAYDATHSKFEALAGQAVSDDAARKVLDQVSEEFVKTFKQRVTEVIRLVGPSMIPTLNRKAASNPSESELLVLRRLRQPSEANVRVGDVVAFTHPIADSLMVRRVLGVPGDVFADDTNELVLDADKCWVVADNEALEPPHVEDSRTFGPLSLKDVEGRVIYAIRSLTDHGPVENSPSSKSDDAPLLDIEVPDILNDPELFEFREKPQEGGDGGSKPSGS